MTVRTGEIWHLDWQHGCDVVGLVFEDMTSLAVPKATWKTVSDVLTGGVPEAVNGWVATYELVDGKYRLTRLDRGPMRETGFNSSQDPLLSAPAG